MHVREVFIPASRSWITDVRSVISVRSHASITPATGATACGRYPLRTVTSPAHNSHNQGGVALPCPIAADLGAIDGNGI